MASAPSSLYRQARYRGTSRSWHAVRRLQAGAWLLAFALIGGGCSVSYQLDGLHANKDAGVPDQGDSPRAAEPKATAEMPAEAALAIPPSPLTHALIQCGNQSHRPSAD